MQCVQGKDQTGLLGQLFNLIPLPFEGIDSGFESFGWLLTYAVCANALAED